MRISIITAVLLCVAYAAFLAYGPRPALVKTQSPAQENRYVMEKYLRSSERQAVLFVGSSMTRRLDFQESGQCVYNLALDGDSVLTGLSAILVSSRIPRIVFVEINVPERAVSKELIASASGILPRISPVFYTENVPVNLLFSFVYQLRKERAEEKVSEKVFQIAFDARRRGYEKPVDVDVLDKNLANLERLTRELQARGARVIFFEIPMHSDIERSARAEQIRAAFKRTFPKDSFLSYRDLSRGVAIKTRDGVHLYSDEAKSVVLNLQPFFLDACA